MSTYTDSSGIHTTGRILAQDLVDIANYYRQWFSVNFSAPGANARITADMMNTLRLAILTGAGNAAYSVVVPNTVSANDRISPMGYSTPVNTFQSTTYTYTNAGTYTLTVPPGAHSIVIYCVGGGGGGGSGYFLGTHYVSVVAVSGGFTQATQSTRPGEILTITVGAGGIGGNSGTHGVGTTGGDSSVIGNISVNLSAGGGGGSSHASVNMSSQQNAPFPAGCKTDGTSPFNGWGVAGAPSGSSPGYSGSSGGIQITLNP